VKLIPIVEGDGEVAAFPVLLRRLVEWRTPGAYVEIGHPIRVRRDRFINRDTEFQRFLALASAKCGMDGWILILLDADDDCPAALGPLLLGRARSFLPADRRVSVVLANREYEAWLIAAAQSLDGHRGFSLDAPPPAEPERLRDAKGWIRQRIAGNIYGTSTDQPAFTARMDLDAAATSSRSFRKLCAEWDRHMNPVRRSANPPPPPSGP
jgi:hypothetical protein